MINIKVNGQSLGYWIDKIQVSTDCLNKQQYDNPFIEKSYELTAYLNEFLPRWILDELIKLNESDNDGLIGFDFTGDGNMATYRGNPGSCKFVKSKPFTRWDIFLTIDVEIDCDEYNHTRDFRIPYNFSGMSGFCYDEFINVIKEYIEKIEPDIKNKVRSINAAHNKKAQEAQKAELQKLHELAAKLGKTIV